MKNKYYGYYQKEKSLLLVTMKLSQHLRALICNQAMRRPFRREAITVIRDCLGASISIQHYHEICIDVVRNTRSILHGFKATQLKPIDDPSLNRLRKRLLNPRNLQKFKRNFRKFSGKKNRRKMNQQALVKKLKMQEKWQQQQKLTIQYFMLPAEEW